MTTTTIGSLYADDLELTIDQQGNGRPVLLLHGGGGPPSMGALPSALAEDFEVIAPVHPGFAGTPRPDWYTGIDDISLTYLQLLEQRDLRDVLVIGSSVGGWIAAEMAVRDHERITGTVLLNAVGINVDGIELADFFSLSPRELITYAFHGPAAAPDPTQLPPAARDIQAANAATLAVYAREPYMHDPSSGDGSHSSQRRSWRSGAKATKSPRRPTGARTRPHSRTADSNRSRRPDISHTSSSPSRSSTGFTASRPRQPARPPCSPPIAANRSGYGTPSRRCARRNEHHTDGASAPAPPSCRQPSVAAGADGRDQALTGSSRIEQARRRRTRPPAPAPRHQHAAPDIARA